MNRARSDMGERHTIVTLEKAGERLDKALVEVLPELSRSQIQRLIKNGYITIAGRPVKANQRLLGDERVSVTIPERAESKVVGEPIPLDVRYEDEDLILVDKPAGMVVHPAVGHEHGTLVNAILAYCPEIEGVGDERRPGIVHRLDKETSGLILIAKNDRAIRFLQDQFERRVIKKAYLALVEGRFKPAEAKIDAPIGRNPRDRKRMAVIPAGSSARARSAVTDVRLTNTYGDFSLLTCYPLTGRTHQIRVHLAFAGYPIVGDSIYGRRKQRIPLNRHFLHASALTFCRPSDGREMSIQADLPIELKVVLESLV